jgi:hypothetical protein
MMPTKKSRRPKIPMTIRIMPMTMRAVPANALPWSAQAIHPHNPRGGYGLVAEFLVDFSARPGLEKGEWGIAIVVATLQPRPSIKTGFDSFARGVRDRNLRGGLSAGSRLAPPEGREVGVSRGRTKHPRR